MDKYTIYIIILAVIVILILSTLAATRAQVLSTYKKYDKFPCELNITAGQFIMASKKYLKMFDLNIARTDIILGDAYDVKSKTIILSENVLTSNSVSAISIASHELGHAMQHNDEYAGLQVNFFLTVVTGFLVKFLVPLLLASIGLMIFGSFNTGMVLMYCALGIFLSSIIIKLLLIPVEINASKRAIQYLKQNNILNKRELIYAKRILGVAACTYIYLFFDAILLPIKLVRKLFLGF
ncbi:MAG: zinc metallopeptidase [Clostridia bacterium]|jgi:hypothetical protein|nr:zinc metallopeptidase [Clostridia bacterium]MDD4275450.1 zinc metallopeptidase [Clostridia bacterium]